MTLPSLLLRCLAMATAMLLLPVSPCSAFTDADADRMFDAYNTAFYQAQSGTNRAYYKENTDGGRAWFWGQANMMEMVADAYDRAPNQDKRNRLAALCRGFTNYHGNDWGWNEYNDDNIWACIVFTKAYLATNDTSFLTRATTNFDIVWNRAWATSLGGGLYWKVGSTGRNACVNAPAAIAACMLYDITGNTAYLDKARAIITWMDANLVVTSSGAIDDHITPSGSRVDWRFTYNQGTYVGACSMLYRITGEIGYLQNAIKSARYTRDSMCNAAGIFPNHGTSGDGGGFNGIGIRWIARMVRDQGLWDEFYPWLKANAEAAWTIRRTADDLSWANWRAATPVPPAVLFSFGCYGSVVALQVVPSSDPSDITGQPGSAIYQAENAVFQGAIANSTEHSGFRGTGYADYNAGIGESITWTVNAAAAGQQWVSFRYANGGTANRPVRLRVNGSMIQDLPFAPTGGWPTWWYTPGVLVTLNAGTNTIQLSPNLSSAPNVDLLYLCAAPAAPPSGATVLFDGTAASLTTNWRRDENGANPSWTVSAGAMSVAQTPVRNDISTVKGYRDFKLHLEWLAPPGGLGREAANSGVKLQGRYEVQILNTPRGQTNWNYTAGAIQGRRAPDANASLGAGHWQSYDIEFTAARWNGAAKISDARVTVHWNGVLVHNNIAIPAVTEDSPPEAPGWHPLLLQAATSTASGPVRFRNVWVVPKTTEILEAESATLVGPTIASGNAGFTGTGFADYGLTTGETITWTVDAEKSANHWLTFRYANGSTGGSAGNRPLSLMVNGVTIRQLDFGPSGGWTTWISTPGVAVPLNAGSNTVRLVSTMNNGPNVDHLLVDSIVPGPSTPAEFWAEWLDNAALAGVDREATRDTDHDGLSNLWEYITGGNPKLADVSAADGQPRAPRMTMVASGGRRYADFTFIRRADLAAKGLTISAEVSTVLGAASWTSRAASVSGAPQPVGDGSHERVTVRVDLGLDTEPRVFVRLKAELAGS